MILIFTIIMEFTIRTECSSDIMYLYLFPLSNPRAKVAVLKENGFNLFSLSRTTTEAYICLWERVGGMGKLKETEK